MDTGTVDVVTARGYSRTTAGKVSLCLKQLLFKREMKAGLIAPAKYANAAASTCQQTTENWNDSRAEGATE